MGALKFEVHMEGLDALQSVLNTACSKAEHKVAEKIQTDTSPFVPFRNGVWLDGGTRVVGSSIIYPGPYARYLYNGKLMVDPETGSPFAPYGTKKVVIDRDLVFDKTHHSQAQSHWFEASKAQNLEKWVRFADKVLKDEL